MGGIRPSTTVRSTGVKYDVRVFAHLLCFIESVNLIKEYDSLSRTEGETGGSHEDNVPTV